MVRFSIWLGACLSPAIGGAEVIGQTPLYLSKKKIRNASLPKVATTRFCEMIERLPQAYGLSIS